MSTLDQGRWRRIDRILEAVLDRPAAERSAVLASECASDHELRVEVESLIAAHNQQDSFLERPCGPAGLVPPMDNEANSFVGQTLGTYRILRRLGIGGLSEVYLAEDCRLARPVALKLLTRCWAADRDNARRLRREALAASALNHPNILTIYEIGESNGHDFIATEYVDGLTLREYMRSGPIPVATIVNIALQMATALNAAHTAGIVHRDIKPENVMIRPDGLIKILDFGIAKKMRLEGEASAHAGATTGTGLVMGTAAYMSPEQARGYEVDARTDLWSLGVVIYEMLAGRVPFPGATTSDRIAGILERHPEPVAKLRPELPVPLQRIVSFLLAKDRDERYRDAAAVLNDLRDLRVEVGDEAPVRWRFRLHERMRVWVIVVLLGIAVPIGGWYFWAGAQRYRDFRTETAHDSIRSLAVLPFANAGGGSEAEYLSDGITDTLINDLSEIAQLKVMSHNSVFRYKGREIDGRKAADALGVRALLIGRVVQRGDDVSVSVELVDAHDNSHIWGQQYRRKLANIVEVQEGIAHDIAERLRLRLSKEERDRLDRRRTSSAEAYQAYLKGRFYWFKRAYPSWLPGSATDFGKSRVYYQQAIEADPGYALAYAGLGHYYAMAGGNELMRPDEAWPKAEAAFKKALELDPDATEARTGLAVLKWVYYRDWAGAEEELRRAIRLAPPSRPEPLYARLLVAEGRFDEGIAQMRRAVELDPLSIRYSSGLGLIYYYSRQYDQCIRQYHKTLELDPDDVSVHEALATAYWQKGLHDEAIAQWSSVLTIGGDAAMAATLDRVYARDGFLTALRALARSRLHRLNALAKRGEFAPALAYARAHLMLGNNEEALRSLAKACDERTVPVLFLNVDPFYDELRAHPSFQGLVKRIRLPN